MKHTTQYLYGVEPTEFGPEWEKILKKRKRLAEQKLKEVTLKQTDAMARKDMDEVRRLNEYQAHLIKAVSFNEALLEELQVSR